METEAYQRLSWVLQCQNRNEEALQVTRQGLLTDPEAKDLHNALGTIGMRLGRNEKAHAAYQCYIQLAPNDPNAWDSLALFEQWIGQYAAAEAAYQRALSLNPESGVAIIHQGQLRFQQGRYRAAAEQYRRFIQTARDDNARARGYGCLAWLYLHQGDIGQASAAAKEELKYASTEGWHSLMVAQRQGNQAAAGKLQAIVLAPELYRHYHERGRLRLWEYRQGYVALRQGRGDEALHHFRLALQQRAAEWNYDSWESCLADALLELGHVDEAIAEYECILKINPHYPLSHFQLGQAYERFLQDWQEAEADASEIQQAKRWLANSR